MSGHGQKQSSDTEWTLILWDIENVAVPEELRHAAGVQLLTETLKAEFATKLNKELHCIKLACRWSHPQSPYSDLLGSLTTLGDVEALSYQWQGHPGDKVHNADRMLRRAADRFMHMMERKGPNRPQHLVVFITSDEDFSEKVTELRARNFDVQVLYHSPFASRKPVSIIHAANKAYDWLPFLRAGLQLPQLTLEYDPSLYHTVTRYNRANAGKHAAKHPAAAVAAGHQAQPRALSGQSSSVGRQPYAPSGQSAHAPQLNRPPIQASGSGATAASQAQARSLFTT